MKSVINLVWDAAGGPAVLPRGGATRRRRKKGVCRGGKPEQTPESDGAFNQSNNEAWEWNTSHYPAPGTQRLNGFWLMALEHDQARYCV